LNKSGQASQKRGFLLVLFPEISLFSFNKTAWETFKQMGLAGQKEFKQVSEIYSTISFMEKNNTQIERFSLTTDNL